MQKLFVLTLLSSLAGTAHAQTVIKAGTIQLGGNVGYSHSSVDSPVSSGAYPIKRTEINNQFILAPSVGFFVADNLAIGVNGVYQINEYKYGQTQGNTAFDQKAKQWRLGAFVQYYKMVSEQFGFTGTLGAGYQYFNEYFSYGSDNTATKGVYANLTPSIVFFPIPKLAIGASIGGLNYSYANYKSPSSASAPDTYESSNFAANFGLSQFLLSGTYYLGR
jgi:outer membrane protein W